MAAQAGVGSAQARSQAVRTAISIAFVAHGAARAGQPRLFVEWLVTELMK